MTFHEGACDQTSGSDVQRRFSMLNDAHAKCTSYMTNSEFNLTSMFDIATCYMPHVRSKYTGCVVLEFPPHTSSYLLVHKDSYINETL